MCMMAKRMRMRVYVNMWDTSWRANEIYLNTKPRGKAGEAKDRMKRGAAGWGEEGGRAETDVFNVSSFTRLSATTKVTFHLKT